MNAPLSEDLGVPSGALAWMAMLLAEERAGPDWEGFFSDPSMPSDVRTREVVAENPDASPVSGEYYRIIDRIARGEKP